MTCQLREPSNQSISAFGENPLQSQFSEIFVSAKEGSLILSNRFLNIRLDGISVEDPERHPHMVRNHEIRNAARRDYSS